MRYLKLLFLVIVFFVLMLFFVQNQTSFDDHVVLTLDLMFMPLMKSEPIPLYALMVISFTLGGVLILLMLMWDRVILGLSAGTAKSKVASLTKKLEKMEVNIKQLEEKAHAKEESLVKELNTAKENLTEKIKEIEELKIAK